MSKHQHYWLATGIPHVLVWLNRKFRYDCTVCGKEKFFRDQPVNPCVPSALEMYKAEVARGNADRVAFPIMQIGVEDQYQQGERYAELVGRKS